MALSWTFDDGSKPRTPRVSYPIHRITLLSWFPKRGFHAIFKVIFLISDAFGVLPPVSPDCRIKPSITSLSGYNRQPAAY